MYTFTSALVSVLQTPKGKELVSAYLYLGPYHVKSYWSLPFHMYVWFLSWIEDKT
jgi:hypothetical protein